MLPVFNFRLLITFLNFYFMLITTPALGLYRNSEFIRYMKNVAEICSNSNPKLLKIDAQLSNLAAATTPLDDLFMIERGNLLTAELQAIDARRDAALSGLRMAASAYSFHFDADIKKAADIIAAAIDKFGTGLVRLNYVAETEVIESLVADVAADAELAAAIAKLQLNDWVAELNTANILFNTTYLSRTSSYAVKPDGNLTELRLVTANAYSELVAHITAHNTLSPSDAYAQLVGKVNSLTEQYNRMVNNRSSSDTIEPEMAAIEQPPAEATQAAQ
jgi:Family of unknown function (DUF6261)